MNPVAAYIHIYPHIMYLVSLFLVDPLHIRRAGHIGQRIVPRREVLPAERLDVQSRVRVRVGVRVGVRR